MNAIKCDICGKFEEVSKFKPIMDLHSVNTETGEVSTRSYDLCLLCRDKLLNFTEGGSNDE